MGRGAEESELLFGVVESGISLCERDELIDRSRFLPLSEEVFGLRIL